MEPAKTVNWSDPSNSVERSEDDVRRRLELFTNLLNTFQRLSLLLENVEKLRETVRPHIYERVKADYLTQKEETERKIEQEELVLRGQYENYSAELQALQATLHDETDRLEELEFRQRVGEYSEEATAGQRDTLKQQVFEHNERLSWLAEITDEYLKTGIVNNPEPAMSTTPSEGPQSGPQAPPDENTQKHTDSLSFLTDEKVYESFNVVEEADPQEDLPVIICPEVLPPRDAPIETSGLKASTGQSGTTQGYVGGYLTALEGSRKGERFPLICSDISLGRSSGNDIRLNDPGISKFHARIVYKDHRYYLENFDPMAGCYVNGVPAGYYELKDGNIIRIGEIKLRVDFAAA